MIFLAQQAQQGPPPQPLPHPKIPDPLPVQPELEWWVYAAAGFLVCTLIGLLLWLLLRPSKATPPPMKKPWNAAMNRLRDLLVAAAQQEPSHTSAQVSECLRQYFLDRYRIPAPFRTSQELFEASDSRVIPPQKVQRYAPLAQLWDELSFAPVPKDQNSAQELVQKAISYLEEDRS